MHTPMTAVMTPPVASEMLCGRRCEMSFDGDSTLAAMLVESYRKTRSNQRVYATCPLA